MVDTKRIAMAGGTVACALGIGFVMQNGAAANDRYSAETPIKTETQGSIAPMEQASQTGAILDVEQITLTSASVVPIADAMINSFTADTPVETVAAPEAELPEPQPDTLEAVDDCAMVALAEPKAAAMVHLTLSAPCFPNERVSVHHNGLIFSDVTDMSGAIAVDVPALSQQALFVFAFANGEGAVAETEVSSLEFYDRVAVQWKGDSGFQVHALEFGAAYGSEGHVWSEAPRDLTVAVSGQGGFLTQLGNSNTPEPLLAEIYTFPSGMTSHTGDVALSVEAEVTTRNCGEEIEAQSLQVRGLDGVRSHDLIMSVPACNAIGDFLVLNNLLQDLKIARN